MAFFGEEFLIKLGFDVDSKQLEKVRKELEKLKNLPKRPPSKPQDPELIAAKNKLRIERQRLQIRKKMDRLKAMNYKGVASKLDVSKVEDKNLDRVNLALDKVLRTTTNRHKKNVAAEREITKEKKKQLAISRKQTSEMRKAVNGFAHAFAGLAASYAAFTQIRDAQQVKFRVEDAETQMQIAFGDDAKNIMDKFVNQMQGLNLGIGKVASLETLSHVAPALRGKFSKEDTRGISQELLLVGKFSGQLGHMAEIARNFGQITTSLEGEDINQFADRFTGLMPFIYENLEKEGKIETADKAGFRKAKDAGQITSEDFVKSFRKTVQRISKDEKLLAKLGGKLNVAWGTLISSIEGARLDFMGKIDEEGKDDGRTSLSEQLKETYEQLTAFFNRSTRTWRAWGEVLGTVIKGMTYAFLTLEEMYLSFAIWLKHTFFGGDDDAARRAAIWILLGAAVLPLVGLFAKLALSVGRLLKIFTVLLPKKETLKNASNLVKTDLLGAFKAFGKKIGETFKSLGKWLGRVGWLSVAMNLIEAAGAGFSKGFTSPEFFRELTQLALWTAGAFFAAMTGGLSLLVADFFSTWVEVWDTNKDILENLKNVFKESFLGSVYDWLTSLSFMKATSNWIVDTIFAIQDKWKGVTGAWDNFVNTLSGWFDSALSILPWVDSDEDEVKRTPRKSRWERRQERKLAKFRPVGSSEAEKQIGEKGLTKNSNSSVVATDNSVVNTTYNIQEAGNPINTVNAIEKTKPSTGGVAEIAVVMANNGG
jgi:hypothetical protein